MPTFHCKIGTSDGRILEKDFDGNSSSALRENLEEQGFHVFSIKSRPFSFLSAKGGRGRFGGRRFLTFNQEFLVLIRSGLPILQVLDTIIERMEHGALLEVLRDIRNDIKAGSSLSEAFGKFPKFFPSLYIASLRAGERTGDLPVTISRYIDYQKRVESIREKVKSASFYPILLTVAVLVVFVFLMLYVVPSFTQIYADASVELPLITRVLISVAELMTRGAPVLFPSLITAVVAVRTFFKTDRGRALFDKWILRLPFFGALLGDYALSSFCRTFSMTLASGIPAVQAMQMSRGTLNNQVLERALVDAVRHVEEGTPISTALEETRFFPTIALRMISVGETTGALSDMLNDVSEYYETEVARRLDQLTSLIEPIMMLTMGLLIGGIVVAMYIPIFELAGTIR